MLALNKWGPSGWHLIHVIMMTSPLTLNEQQRSDMKSFLLLLGKHLPCPKCQVHFSNFVREHATDERVGTREALVALMNDCHNEVNRRNGKPEFTLKEHREWLLAGPPPKHEHYALWIVVVCIALVTVHTLRKKRKNKTVT